MSAAQGHLRTLEEEEEEQKNKKKTKKEKHNFLYINNLVRNYERKNIEQLRQHCEKKRVQNTLCLMLKRTLDSKGATRKAGRISVIDCRITVACKTVRAQEVCEQGGGSWLSFIPIPFSPRPQ